MEVEKKQQKTWNEPNGHHTGIFFQNTLSREINELILPEDRPKLLKWYICGPTVYNSSHLGHARTYLTFDIIRRILENHFNINVFYQCNITDVDDKIIKRANELGTTIYGICRKYEAEFLDDLKSLNIKAPTAITRVTEYIDEIIAFIQRIIDHGFAYPSMGSVYFDVNAYMAAGHVYPKLNPSAWGNTELLNEGEGLSMKNRVEEKHSPVDFALWKATKPGEPSESSWEAPWGAGRPGWHIECSAMGTSVLGENFDLHTGGQDLIFPHHDNELAQSEAATGLFQCVNYFMHAGHLRINGDIMSKSKMNFTTIRDALKIYSPNQLRMLFTLVSYSSALEYSAQFMDNAIGLDRRLTTCIQAAAEALKADLIMRDEAAKKAETVPHKWRNIEWDLHNAVADAVLAIDKAYRNNFDYPTARERVFAVVDQINKYLLLAKEKGNYIIPAVITEARDFIVNEMNKLGFSYTTNGNSTGSDSDSAETLRNLAEVTATLRANIKETITKVTEEQIEKSVKIDILRKLDEVRDSKLPENGFALEDGADGTWKLIPIDIEDWKKQKFREQELKGAAERKKKALAEEKEKKLAAEKQAASILAEEMFKSNPEYSTFDEKGIPTALSEKDEEGNYLPIPKSRAKKLIKEWEAKKKLNIKYGFAKTE